MPWSLRVITGLTADTEPSLILKFESPPAKYIFNVPEGTNRACIQKRYGIAKTKAAFLTRLHPEQIGGFPGLVMMLADINSRDLTVCGPAGLTHYIASTRFYARRTAFGVNVNEYKHHDLSAAGNATLATLPPPIFQDENIVVHSIALYPSAVDDTGSTGSPSGSSKRKRSSSASPPPSPKRRSTEGSPLSNQLLEPDAPLPNVPTEAPLDEAGRIHRERILHLMFRPPVSTTGDAVTTDDMDLDKAAASAPNSPSRASSSTSDPKQLWNRRLPKFRETPQTLAYFVVGPATRGKFDAKRAKELGVVGAMCSKLTRGETVTTPNGNVVTPDMCVGPSTPPSAFLFLHVPDPTYIDSIISRPESFLAATYGSTVQLHAIIHRVGPGVLEDKRYREWMASFDPTVNVSKSPFSVYIVPRADQNTYRFCNNAHLRHLDLHYLHRDQHMIASERYSPDQITYSSSARMQLELSYLDNEIFRPPYHHDTPSASLSSWPDLPPKTSILALDTEVSMHPRLDPAPARFVPSDDFKATLEAINAGSYVHPLEDIYTSARKDAESSSPSHLPANPNGQDITITALGTVSATLIQIPSYGNILLDSGEGTWGQLARQFGQPIISEEGQASGGVIDILRDLKCIFISHVHGDHHMGLAKILARRHQLNPSLSEPLYLIANRLTLHYLSELNDVVDFGFHDRRHISVVDAEDVYYLNGPAKLKATLGLESIQTVDVEHRTQCYGLVLRHKDEWSVVYSGDTMPCTRLVEAGQDATVLIHEATMADDQVDLALAKAHSTAGQAIDVGRRMNAKNILLTHFSQRYPKMPELQGPALADESLTSPSEEPRAPVAIAFDCATLRLGSLWKMEKYMGAMAQTFEKEPDEASDGGVPLDGTEAPATSSSPSKGKKNKKEKRSEAKTA